jgi:hypothetical protein
MKIKSPLGGAGFFDANAGDYLIADLHLAGALAPPLLPAKENSVKARLLPFIQGSAFQRSQEIVKHVSGPEKVGTNLEKADCCFYGSRIAIGNSSADFPVLVAAGKSKKIVSRMKILAGLPPRRPLLGPIVSMEKGFVDSLMKLSDLRSVLGNRTLQSLA